jgi:hypothetical protein
VLQDIDLFEEEKYHQSREAYGAEDMHMLPSKTTHLYMY